MGVPIKSKIKMTIMILLPIIGMIAEALTIIKYTKTGLNSTTTDMIIMAMMLTALTATDITA